MYYLAGDIGGTKTHLALYVSQDESVKRIAAKKFPSGDYKDLETIVKEFWGVNPCKIVKACFGIAGPVRNNICRATNLPWIIDAKNMELDLGIEEVFLINDLEANAYGIKTLDPSNFYVINRGDVGSRGNQALISAGTGLGEAGFYFDGKTTRPFACEGGHTDFAPQNMLEIELLKFLMEKFGHVSYERILCGSGFYEIYEFLVEKMGFAKSPMVENRGKNEDPSIIISKEALRETDPTCVETMRIFIEIFGSEAGNLVLKFLATGGLYIGGGIAPKILEALKKRNFFDAFIKKGRFEDLLRTVPVKVVLDDETALKGAAYYCHHAS